MKKQSWKSFCVRLIVLMICAGNICGVSVLAKETKKTTEKTGQASTMNGMVNFGKGNAAIRIEGNEGQTLKGKSFRLYHLFYAENALGEESIQYTFDERYQKPLKKIVGIRLSRPEENVTEYMVIDYMQTFREKESEMRYFIEELRDEIKASGITGDMVHVADVKADGSVEIQGLPYGYYIVDEVTDVQGENSAASLCMVNTASPGAEIQIKSDYPTIMKKIREDDDREKIGGEGWNDIGDFEIGQTVPYRYVSDIPDMRGYDTYYFAWQDRMNEALTFQADTVEIVIHGRKDQKEYKLPKSEFRISMMPEQDVTFCVEIPDLKAIMEREFEGENPSEGEIILRYDATLNDRAAEDTGRPGFENDVRLEFSNNPDSDGKGSTGKTPWDTVVCFTYRLDGLKTNDEDRTLEGAKFRLYSDEKCEKEVYVKKSAQGYIVINRDSVGGTDHTGGSVPEDAEEIVSDMDGVFRIYGLDGGVYWLKETEAPTGYRPILDPIRIEVMPTFCAERNEYMKGEGATENVLKKLEFKVHIRQFLSGIFEESMFTLESDVNEGNGNLKVVNQSGKRLPGTGSSMMMILLIIGTGMVFLAMKKRGKDAAGMEREA